MESKKYLTPEKDLILRIIEQWGNAATMGEMEQWLKDYAANAHASPRWVNASEFKTHKPVYRPYRKPAMEDEGEYDYGEIYVTEDDSRIYLDVDNECNYEHQSDERWKDYEILDESVKSTGESEAVVFAEWIRASGIEPTFGNKWVDFSKSGDNRYTTAELYTIFKQQKAT